VNSVTIEAPIQDMPGLMHAAVAAVCGATAIEITPDGAIVARRTNFAMQTDTTRFSFHAIGSSTTEIRAEVTIGGIFGLASYQGVVADTGHAVVQALVRIATLSRDRDVGNSSSGQG
jgi:hypothetical protein